MYVLLTCAFYYCLVLFIWLILFFKTPEQKKQVVDELNPNALYVNCGNNKER